MSCKTAETRWTKLHQILTCRRTGPYEAHSKGQGTPVAQALHPAGESKEVYKSTSENLLNSVLSSVVQSNPQTLVKQG